MLPEVQPGNSGEIQHSANTFLKRLSLLKTLISH